MDRFSSTGLSAWAECYRYAVEGLPIPLIMLDAREPGWPVILSNRAFAERLSTVPAPVGRPLLKVLPSDAVLRAEGPEGPLDLEDVLQQVRRSGQAAMLDLVLARHPAPEGVAGTELPAGGTKHWSARVQALTEPASGIWALLMVLRDPAEDGLAVEPHSLAALAQGLGTDTSADAVYAGALHAAVSSTGAGRGALLLSDGEAGFTVLSTTPGSGVAEGLVVHDVPSITRQVASGPLRLRWEAPAPPATTDRAAGEPEAPLPFAGTPGWERLLLVGLRLRQRVLGLIAVAEPGAGWFDHRALDRLATVSEFVSLALDNLRLVESFARLEQFLRGAVRSSAGLVDATEPSLVRRQFLDGLVAEMGLSGAALWRAADRPRGRAELVDWAGLPEAVRQRVALLDPASAAAQMAATGRRRRPRAAIDASSSWPGRFLRLVPVPEPARGTLGVYTDRPLPDLVDEVLATLTHAFAAAVHQTTLHKRARTVVNSLQRELRPRLVAALPDTMSVGTVYRSATAGVDVGGDFFDVFCSFDGRVGVVCGDVSGKGVEAASLTAMAVYSLRAYGLRGAAPAEVLPLLNGSVCAQTGSERFITLAYLRIDPDTWTVQLGLAGHPPPLLVGPHGVEVLGMAPDVPVGVDEHSEFAEAEIHLEQGHSLVLYTDGVTEARQYGVPNGALLGLDGLIRAVVRLAGDPGAGAQDLASGIYRAVVEWTRDGTSDDCAIVVVRRAAAGEDLGSLGMDIEIIP